MIYLDNSATTRQAEEVTEKMTEVMRNDFGNPSSLHQLGVDAEKEVENARGIFSKTLGVTPEEIWFNSGGTEGDNTVLFGVGRAKKHQGNRIITTEVEHPAILEPAKALEEKGFRVEYLPVDQRGMPDLDCLNDLMDESVILVSVMAVNNETGTIMPLSAISRIVREKGKGKTLLHTDAVQGYGKLDFRGADVDFLSVSGHKIHGPKGVGALYVRKGVHLPAMILGGGQERGRRSGTENVPGIAGFGKACELAYQDPEKENQRMERVKSYLLQGIREEIPDIRVNTPEESVPSVLNVSFLGTRGEVILHTLEQDKIYVSTGSACSSHKKGQSHVLRAMGLTPEETEGAIRFSFSRYNTEEEMDQVLDSLKRAVKRFRKLGSFR